MENILNRKNICFILLFYFICAVLFYYAAYDRINFTEYAKGVTEFNGYTEELVHGSEITEEIQIDCDYIYNIKIAAATFGRENEGNIDISLEDASGNVLISKKFKANKIEDNSDLILALNKAVHQGKYTLKIASENAGPGKSITVYYNSEDHTWGGEYFLNGIKQNGTLLINIEGGMARTYGYLYWPVIFVCAGLLLVYLIISAKLSKYRKTNYLVKIMYVLVKYRFLIKQLVNRDFKTKYKRSVLGVGWSLLYPILLMVVQYVMFSTIFRSNIENYPVYLLSGSVLFTFFTDSVSAGLMAIVGNSSLITKVYVPKYIYPVSKVLSTSINLFLSMIPLFMVVLITGESITKACLLIPYVFLCILIFCIGMSFLLSASMVFFRDTQFLWSVAAMLWMYATPMFYPASIIPQRWSIILTANPMYHYISFLRTILMKGISPNVMEYVYCMGFSLLILAAGVWVYKKTQNKFILYI